MTNSLILYVVGALVGTGGIGTVIIAFLKLRPERDSAAVTQAQGAMAMQHQLLRDMERDRDYWCEEAKRRGREIERLRKQFERAEAQVAQLTQQLEQVKADLSAIRKSIPSK